MSFDDAVSALDNAIEVDSGSTPQPASAPIEQAPTPSATPEGESVTPQVQPTPGREFTRDDHGRFAQPTPPEPQPTADTFDEGKFNPDLLPPELQPGWKQLQAAFTQKTQSLAERASQFEGMDPAVAREAVELYTALQDPNYLVQFHGELTTALQAQGLTPAQASAEAARQVEEATGQNTGSVNDQLAALRNDPELAPVADAFSQLRQDFEALQAERHAEREQQETAQMQMALAGELIRQESVLKENGYGEKAMDRIYALSPNHGGNLLEAAHAYDQMREELLSEYLESKQVVEPGVAPVAGSGQVSEVPTAPQNLDDALLAALTHLDQSGIDTLA